MAKPRAGQLDKRVTIQAGTASISASGASEMSFANVPLSPCVWARVEPIPGGGEVDEAGRLQPRAFWRVTIRRRSDITRAHRFLYGSRALYVKDVGDDHKRTPHVEYTCTEYPP